MIEQTLTLEYFNKSMNEMSKQMTSFEAELIQSKAEIQHLTEEVKKLADKSVQLEAKIQHLTIAYGDLKIQSADKLVQSEARIEHLTIAYGDLKIQSADELVQLEAKIEHLTIAYGDLKTYILDSQKGTLCDWFSAALLCVGGCVGFGCLAVPDYPKSQYIAGMASVIMSSLSGARTFLLFSSKWHHHEKLHHE